MVFFSLSYLSALTHQLACKRCDRMIKYSQLFLLQRRKMKWLIPLLVFTPSTLFMAVMTISWVYFDITGKYCRTFSHVDLEDLKDRPSFSTTELGDPTLLKSELGNIRSRSPPVVELMSPSTPAVSQGLLDTGNTPNHGYTMPTPTSLTNVCTRIVLLCPIFLCPCMVLTPSCSLSHYPFLCVMWKSVVKLVTISMFWSQLVSHCLHSTRTDGVALI